MTTSATSRPGARTRSPRAPYRSWPTARGWSDYPLTLITGEQHVAALSDALATFGRTARIGIDEMNDLGDKDSADLLTEISRGIDKWLWFVEAHQQGESSTE